MNWIDSLFGKQEISKEAAVTPVGSNAAETADRKIEASGWMLDIAKIDADQVDKEYQSNLEAEAKMLGKTAAYSAFETQDETLKKDLARDLHILSDYALSEILMDLRGTKEQNLPEMYVSLKEKAKADVKASRAKCEQEVLDSMTVNAQLDWKKAFEKYTKEAKPEEPKEKDLFSPKLEKINEDEWATGKKDDKDFIISDKEKTTQGGAGNGREEDERTDVTKQPGEPQEKKASIKVDAFLVRDPDYELHVGNKITLARSIMSKEGTILEAGGDYEITGTEGERYIITANGKSYTACRFDTPKFFVTAEKVKDTADKDKGNQALPEGKETAGDKPSEAVDGTTLPADKKEVGDKADRAEEKNSFDKGNDVETIESVDKKASKKCPHCEHDYSVHHSDGCIGGQGKCRCEMRKQDIDTYKESSLKEAHCGTCPGDPGVKATAEMCPVCGGEGKDLANGENDHYSCMGCGISYGHKTGSCGHCGSIASHASKEEVIKIIKKAEVQSPWVVVEKDGQEMIARREVSELVKESEEDLEKELQK